MPVLGSTIYLAITAAFFVYTAVTSAANPAAFANQLGLSILNAGGVNEIRSQYAGFSLAGAILCGLGLTGAVSRQATCMTLAVIFGGLIGGRIVSLFLNGGMAGFGPSIRALYVVDGLGFAAACWLLAARHAT